MAIIVAAGGIGKSALTDEWLQHIAQENYYGKTRVFGWSFYSQGSHNTFTNSQPFFSAFFEFLNKHRPKDDLIELPKDEIEKARVLATCLQQQPCLLVLDGLEPLQYAQNLAAMNGELQDSALKEFFLQFRQNTGKSFVLLSSRQPLVELKKWQPEHFLSLDLQTLPHQEGAELLLAIGVTGKTAERQAISQDLNGHALSLVLFGHLLREHHQGDCRYAKELPPLTTAHGRSDAEKDSRHALRVLDYYDSLQDPASRCFLQLLGLFDRPMNAAEKSVLIANANHAEPLCVLTDSEWKKLEQRLEISGLLLGKKGTFERLEWDTHPIIRSFFGEKFKENHPEEFQQAHEVLACYFYNLPEKKLPDILDEMLPLYRAVAHGCLAEKYNFSLNEIYYKRIRRSDKNYSSHFLGAYAQALTALSNFFSNDWRKLLKTDLSEAEQNYLLGEVSFNLMFLGRLTDAIEPMRAILARHEQQQDRENACISASNLSDLYRSLGQLSLAKSSAQLSCIYALKITNTDYPIMSLSYQAAALHYEAKTQDALGYFLQAKNIAQQNNTIYLGSVYGYWYCNHLLDCRNGDVFLERLKSDLLEDTIFQERIPSSNEKSALVFSSEYKQHLLRAYSINITN